MAARVSPTRRATAIVGADALDLPVIIDGLNDQGLSIGLFYFPDYAKYAEATPENAKHAIAPVEFGLWVLGNFATVDEVKAGVKDIVVVPTPAPGLGSPQGMVPAHISSSRTRPASLSRLSRSTAL